MLNLTKRDVKIKGRKFRNNGRATGVINRKNRENIAISAKISDLNNLLAKCGEFGNLEVNLDGEIIKTSISEVQRDAIIHNAININLKEI